MPWLWLAKLATLCLIRGLAAFPPKTSLLLCEVLDGRRLRSAAYCWLRVRGRTSGRCGVWEIVIELIRVSPFDAILSEDWPTPFWLTTELSRSTCSARSSSFLPYLISLKSTYLCLRGEKLTFSCWFSYTQSQLDTVETAVDIESKGGAQASFPSHISADVKALSAMCSEGEHSFWGQECTHFGLSTFFASRDSLPPPIGGCDIAVIKGARSYRRLLDMEIILGWRTLRENPFCRGLRAHRRGKFGGSWIIDTLRRKSAEKIGVITDLEYLGRQLLGNRMWHWEYRLAQRRELRTARAYSSQIALWIFRLFVYTLEIS